MRELSTRGLLALPDDLNQPLPVTRIPSSPNRPNCPPILQIVIMQPKATQVS